MDDKQTYNRLFNSLLCGTVEVWEQQSKQFPGFPCGCENLYYVKRYWLENAIGGGAMALNSWTPLHMAATRNDLEAELIKNHKINVNINRPKGQKKVKMNKYPILLTVLALQTTACMSQTKKDNTMTQEKQDTLLVEETKNSISYFAIQFRDERADYFNLPFLNNGDFFLYCTSDTYIKESKDGDYIHESFILHLIPERIADPFTNRSADTYVIKCKLLSSTFYNKYGEQGHDHPILEWRSAGIASDNSIYAKILSYYWQHQSEIRIIKNE